MVHLRTGDTFLQRAVTKRLEEVMFLVFMGGFTTALMKQNNHFYLFDSHSKDERGLSIVGGNFWILGKLRNICRFFYLEYRSLEQSCFQLQFILVNVDRELSSDILCILCSHQISSSRMKYRLHTRCSHKRRFGNNT